MNAFKPLIREIRIMYLRWALSEIPLTHDDVPKIVMQLNDLRAQRPHQLKTRAPCCHGDCYQGRDCPLRGIHHGDGGFRVDGSQSTRLHPEDPSDRALIGAVGATLIALAAAVMQALGLPVSLLF